ncbi:MAG TPA: hypothetical protein VKR56_01730 [Candidatus Cybelea sp.]|nr:hypothetical protein [Candidatus Cybelea sp.]
MSVWVAIVLLAGCGGNGNGISSLSFPAAPVHAPETAKAGLYVAYFTRGSDEFIILGYPSNNRRNKAPICQMTGPRSGDGIAVDANGNLIGLAAFPTDEVVVYKGPEMCGHELGSFRDPYGYPYDAASADAATGTIAVANSFDYEGSKTYSGSISVCTLAGGCTSNLTNAAIQEVWGVALDRSGDCWAAATNQSAAAYLIYFKHCAGTGSVATGYKNPYSGSLDIDRSGNLVSLSGTGGQSGELYVYKGCKPACSLVGGPFGLAGEALVGHLDGNSATYATATISEYISGQGEVDVYRYSPTKLTHEYSFTNGIGNNFIASTAYNPRSKE